MKALKGRFSLREKKTVFFIITEIKVTPKCFDTKKN